MLFFLAVFLSGINCYIYCRLHWHKLAALGGGITYIILPYITHNIYNRSALGESWALALIPLGLFLTDIAINQPKMRLILALFFAIFALTHVPSLLLYTIFWSIYVLCSHYKESKKDIFFTYASAIFGFSLAALYLIPAILDQPLVSIANLKNVGGGFQYNIIRLVPYKGTEWHIHSIFSYQLLSVIVFASIAIYCYRKNKPQLLKTLSWLGGGLTLLFLMSYLSLPIWRASATLQMVQFPWRLLGLISFVTAILCTISLNAILIKYSPKKLVFLLLILAILGLNARYTYFMIVRYSGFYKPGNLVAIKKKPRWNYIGNIINNPYADNLKDTWEYYPVIPETGLPVKSPLINQPKATIVKGEAIVIVKKWGSYKRILTIEALQPSLISLRTYAYPTWHLYVNNQLHPIKLTEEGTILFELPQGYFTVELNYEDNFSFKIGKIISTLSLIVWLALVLKLFLFKLSVFDKRSPFGAKS
jgi:hypothetical protein